MTEQRTGEIAQSYDLREGGADLRSLLTLCRPDMRALCTGPEPGDWLEYIYAFLLEKIYPERVKVSERSAREKAVSFYLEVLEEVFERERAELRFILTVISGWLAAVAGLYRKLPVNMSISGRFSITGICMLSFGSRAP